GQLELSRPVPKGTGPSGTGLYPCLARGGTPEIKNWDLRTGRAERAASRRLCGKGSSPEGRDPQELGKSP
ncbi:MAG: hypothetical protein U0361_00175, partial [Nitrospiraceae bacterium]